MIVILVTLTVAWSVMPGRVGLNILEIAGMYIHSSLLRLQRMVQKKTRKHPVSSSSIGRNTLLMQEVSAEWSEPTGSLQSFK